MIKFHTSPVPAEMQVYNGETGGRAWDDAGYVVGVPTDWAANNTEANIKKILQAPASRFAFADTSARASFALAVRDDSTEVMIVLKGIHQFKKKTGTTGIDFAHITVAWTTHLYHLNVGLLGTDSGVIGVAPLGVKSATEGAKAVSSEATGWTAVSKKK